MLDLSSGCRILDAPCGWGRLSLPLARLGATVLGVDQSDRQLAFAAHHLEELPPDRFALPAARPAHTARRDGIRCRVQHLYFIWIWNGRGGYCPVPNPASCRPNRRSSGRRDESSRFDVCCHRSWREWVATSPRRHSLRGRIQFRCNLRSCAAQLVLVRPSGFRGKTCAVAMLYTDADRRFAADRGPAFRRNLQRVVENSVQGRGTCRRWPAGCRCGAAGLGERPIRMDRHQLTALLISLLSDAGYQIDVVHRVNPPDETIFVEVGVQLLRHAVAVAGRGFQLRTMEDAHGAALVFNQSASL